MDRVPENIVNLTTKEKIYGVSWEKRNLSRENISYATGSVSIIYRHYMWGVIIYYLSLLILGFLLSFFFHLE